MLRGAAAAGLVAAAIAAEQIVQPAPARAGTDGDVVLGQSNSTAGDTVITNTSDGVGIEGDGGVGVRGFSEGGYGVFAVSTSGTGVSGGSVSGTGVTGGSTTGVGVAGISRNHWGVSAESDSDTALQAQSKGGIGVVGVGTATGVYGQSGAADGFALTRDGVRGYTNSAAAAGVRGENAAGGPGLSGATTSVGRLGHAAVDGANAGTGPGVRGVGGIGVLAQAKTNGATALEVLGPAVFSRSGLLTIGAGASDVIGVGVKLTAASLVLATLQENLAGIYVASAVPNVAGDSFTVHLNKATPKAAKVAWFIVN